MRSPNYRRFLLFVFLAVVLYITLVTSVFYFESKTPGATIKHFPEAIWYSIVTLTTVGYGDIAPLTAVGKLIASLAMLTGYSIIAVPTGIKIFS